MSTLIVGTAHQYQRQFMIGGTVAWPSREQHIAIGQQRCRAGITPCHKGACRSPRSGCVAGSRGGGFCLSGGPNQCQGYEREVKEQAVC